MSIKTTYGYGTALEMDFEQALDKVIDMLKERGFGILTTIDVKAKMKEKLDKDMDEYFILGACNPPLAAKALDAEVEIGLLLPCNVIVYRKDDKTYVSAVMPKSMMEMIGKKELCEVAETAEAKLRSLIDALDAY